MRAAIPIEARRAALAALLLGVMSGLIGCATLGIKGKTKEPDQLSGSVLDPKGKAIPFTKISIIPQAAYEPPEGTRGRKKKVEQEPLPEGARGLAVTTEGGSWIVDHISGDDGEDLGMPGGWYYEVTVYKPGFHIWKDSVLYEQGTLQLDVTLYPDTINIEDVGNMVDTNLEQTNTGTGVTRQGE